MSDNSEFKGRSGNPAQALSAEQMAALIDGRLSQDERARVLRQLGESDDDLSVVLDAAGAAAYGDALEEEPREVVSIVSASKKRWRGVTLATASLAAAAVAVIVFRTPPGNADSARQMVSALSSHDALPPSWNYTPWRAQRGTENVSDSSAFIRIGVRTTDLELALRARDSVSARLSNDIATLLSDIPGGSAVGAVYRQLAINPESNKTIEEARHALASLPQQDLISLGSWLEAARIASTRHDNAWFNRESNRKRLRTLAAQYENSPADSIAARELVNGSPVWSRIDQIIMRMLYEL